MLLVDDSCGCFEDINSHCHSSVAVCVHFCVRYYSPEATGYIARVKTLYAVNGRRRVVQLNSIIYLVVVELLLRIGKLAGS